MTMDDFCERHCGARAKRLGKTVAELRRMCPSPIECRLEARIKRSAKGGKHELTTTPDRPKVLCPF